MNPHFVRRDQCPICFGSDLQLLYQHNYAEKQLREYLELAYHGKIEYEYLVGQVFEIAKCLGCGFIFQTYILNPSALKQLYDVWIDSSLARNWHLERMHSISFVYARRLSFIAKYFGTSNINILDYGGGFGQFCLMAKAFGFRVSCIEFSEERISSINKIGINVLTLNEFTQIRSEYHFINIDQVLEHVSNPSEIMHNINLALNEAGIVFVGVPDCKDLESSIASLDTLSREQYKKQLQPISALQHINGFTYSTLRDMCARQGFHFLFSPITYMRLGFSRIAIKEFIKMILHRFGYQMSTSQFLLKATREKL